MQRALSKSSGHASQPKDFHWLEKNIPCQHACPAGTDIPGYLAAIARGDYNEAYRINLTDNVFPAVLGRVCARPCEPACRHGWEGLGESVAICFSKRSAGAFHSLDKPVEMRPMFGKSGRRVTVVGAGVAGLAAARDLALWGHEVTVLEKHERPGGMLRQGIPSFRLPREIADREIRQVELCGVKIRCGVEVGRDVTLAQLAADQDAVILAAGTLKPNLPDYPGGDLAGIEHGLPFLMDYNERNRTSIGRRVIVIGGGFTAMDCARAALRLGAESVRVCYRRTADEMQVTPGEREEMEHEGVPMEFLVLPKQFVGENGRVKRVRFVRTKLGEPDASGRRRPEEIPGSEYEVEADTVLLATGQVADTSWSHPLPGGEKIFIAGDFATGATSLIRAIGHARKCARYADRFLMGRDRLREVVHIKDGRDMPREREWDIVPRQPMPSLPLAKRTRDAEVETGHSRNAAKTEADRCYLCHYKYEIDMQACIYCNQCVEVKPRRECIVRVTNVKNDAEGRIVGWNPMVDTLIPGAPPFEYYINQADCIRCNACLEVCPTKCISVQKVSRRTKPQE